MVAELFWVLEHDVADAHRQKPSTNNAVVYVREKSVPMWTSIPHRRHVVGDGSGGLTVSMGWSPDNRVRQIETNTHH